jgi:hypothetical protein
MCENFSEILVKVYTVRTQISWKFHSDWIKFKLLVIFFFNMGDTSVIHHTVGPWKYHLYPGVCSKYFAFFEPNFRHSRYLRWSVARYIIYSFLSFGGFDAWMLGLGEFCSHRAYFALNFPLKDVVSFCWKLSWFWSLDQWPICLVPWEGRVCGSCEWRRHLESGRGGWVPGPEKGASVSFRHRRRQDVNLSEMRRRQKDKEDDPFTAQEHQHAQSKSTCIAGRWAVNPL